MGARLALNTGAASTVISLPVLVAVGLDPAAAPERVRLTTGSGIVIAPRLTVDRIKALGQSRTSFPVLAHTLPPTAPIDGLLGLDFLRGRRLTIDFRAGRITFR
jgi:predicted aspartyl protease